MKDDFRPDVSGPSTLKVHNVLVPLIEKYALNEGVTETDFPGLIVGRSTQPVARFPLLYSPSLCVVAQGRKHVYVAQERA